MARAGQRKVNAERLSNAGEGIRRKDDRLPRRFMKLLLQALVEASA